MRLVEGEPGGGRGQAGGVERLLGNDPLALEPFGAPLAVSAGATGDGFRARSSGPAWDAMVAAMSTAWGSDTVEIATGGAIPLVKAMSDGVPEGALFVFGSTDSFANIHGPNERVLVDEWERALYAETLFFHELAERWKGEAA